MYLCEFIDSILEIRLDDKHTSLDKVLPVLTGALIFKGFRKFQDINGLVKLIVIYIEFDENFESFLDQELSILTLELNTVFQVEYALLFPVDL